VRLHRQTHAHTHTGGRHRHKHGFQNGYSLNCIHKQTHTHLHTHTPRYTWRPNCTGECCGANEALSVYALLLLPPDTESWYVLLDNLEYIYKYKYTYIYIYICLYKYIIYVYKYMYVQIFMYIYMYVCIRSTR